MKTFRVWALFVSLVAVVALSIAVAASAARKPAPTLLHPGPALATLVKRAQAEGTLNFYTVPPDASVRRVVDAFTKRWGVKATWTRFGTAALQDRFGSEATSGNPGADLVLVSNSPWVGFAQQKGWIIGPSKAGIPGWPSGKVPALYPRKFLTNAGDDVGSVRMILPFHFGSSRSSQVFGASDADTWFLLNMIPDGCSCTIAEPAFVRNLRG